MTSTGCGSGVEEGLVDRTLASGAVDAAPPIELVRAELAGDAIHFAGTADTFEANVQLRLMQGTKELADTFVTATCGSGCRGSFDGVMGVPAGRRRRPDHGRRHDRRGTAAARGIHALRRGRVGA